MGLSSNPKTTTEKRKTEKMDIETNEQAKTTRYVHRNNSHWQLPPRKPQPCSASH